MNFVLFLLITTVLVTIQFLIGGTRLAYAIIPYALAGGAAVFSLSGFRRACIKPSALCVGATLAFFFYVIGRAAFSPNLYLARADVCMAGAALIVYLVTAIFLNQPRFRTGIVLVLCALATVQVFVGAIQFSDDTGYMIFRFTRSEIYAAQASGLFLNPSHLAVYLEMAGLMALGYTVWGRYSLTMKLVVGYLLLVCIGGLAIAGNKPGYIAAIGGILAFAALSVWVVQLYKPGQAPLALIGSIILIIAAVGGTGALMQKSTKLNERLTQISRIEKDVRRYHWMAALDQIRFSPIVGTGTETHPAYQRLFRRAPIQTDAQDTHSDYLEIVAEYGAVGGVLAAVFILTHLAAGLRNIREIVSRRLMNTFGPPKTNTLALTIGALSASVALLIHAAFDSTLHAPGNVLVWAFIFGILCNPGLDKESLAQPNLAERSLRGLLGVLGLAMIVGCATWYRAERLSEIAREAFDKNNYARAQAVAERAIQTAPGNAENYYYAGEALRNQALAMPKGPGQTELLNRAGELFRNGLERAPENGNLWIRLGQTLDAIGQFDAAEEAFVQGIATDPNLGILYSYYAEHLRLAGDPDGALECAATAKKLTGPARKLSEMDDPLPILATGVPEPTRK